MHNFSHWCVTHEDEEEVQSGIQEEKNTSMLLERMIQSNEALQQEQMNTNRLLEELIATSQHQSRVQEEQTVINKLCAILLVKPVMKD